MKYQLEDGDDENSGKNIEPDDGGDEESEDGELLEEITEALSDEDALAAEATAKDAPMETTEVPQEVNGIILEDAADAEEVPVVPEPEEEKVDPVEEAMKKRPYGIDSAFDVVEKEASEQEQEPESKIEIPTGSMDEDEDI